MVPILARFHNLVFEEVFLKSMYSLLWTIVPTCVYPFLPSLVLPGPEYLSNNWFRKVIGISYMNPVTYVAAGSVNIFSI